MHSIHMDQRMHAKTCLIIYLHMFLTLVHALDLEVIHHRHSKVVMKKISFWLFQGGWSLEQNKICNYMAKAWSRKNRLLKNLKHISQQKCPVHCWPMIIEFLNKWPNLQLGTEVSVSKILRAKEQIQIYLFCSCTMSFVLKLSLVQDLYTFQKVNSFCFSE